LRDTGLDSDRPTAWIAEGLFGYLPPQAQDRLLDNITALSAHGSRLGTETVPDMSHLDLEKAREMMRKPPPNGVSTASNWNLPTWDTRASVTRSPPT